MRKRETHFEQVPIEVVETVLLQAVALEMIQEKSPELVTTAVWQGKPESPDQPEKAPSKGKK
jgi:hypothetical protein